MANRFVPADDGRRAGAVELVGRCIAERGFETPLLRGVPVNHSVARPAAQWCQLPVVQWVFRAPARLRLCVSVVAKSGPPVSSRHVATSLGFGASAVHSLSARLRAEEK